MQLFAVNLERGVPPNGEVIAREPRRSIFARSIVHKDRVLAIKYRSTRDRSRFIIAPDAPRRGERRGIGSKRFDPRFGPTAPERARILAKRDDRSGRDAKPRTPSASDPRTIVELHDLDSTRILKLELVDKFTQANARADDHDLDIGARKIRFDRP